MRKIIDCCNDFFLMNPVFNLPKIHPTATNQECLGQAMSAVQTGQLQLDIVIPDQNRNEFAVELSRLLALAIDEIAEGVRALSISAPGSCNTLAGLILIDEETGESNAERYDSTASSWARNCHSNSSCSISNKQTVKRGTNFRFADKALQVHEKNAWMLSNRLQ